MKSHYSPNYQNQNGYDTSNKPDFALASNHFYSQKEAIQASFRDAKHFLNLNDVNKNTSLITNNVGSQVSNIASITPSASFSDTAIYNAAGNFQASKHEKKHHGLLSFFKHKKKPVTRIYDGLLYPDPMINLMQTPVVNAFNGMPQEFYKEKEIDIQKYELALNYAQDDQAARQVVCGLLTNHKSLWYSDGLTQDENSFTNILLSSLRHHSIDAYRAIVEEQYFKQWGIAFQKGEATLYRGDTRDNHVIFNEGFKLWPNENQSHIYKCLYAWDNGSVGVSLSKSKNVASDFGLGGYYTVKLPVNHQLLLIPFHDTWEKEVNSMDGIPTQYIQFFKPAKGSSDVIKNPNYDKDAIVVPTVRRGCY